MKKKLSFILAAIMLAAAIAGCGNTDTEGTESSQTEGAGPETQPDDNTDEDTAGDTADEHYPLTIETYNYAGEVVSTTYTQAPEKVLAVYQGSIETMIALGLEDRVVASYGLDNEVKDEWKEGLEKMNYDDSVFAPDKETVVMMEPDLIFSWGSLLGETTLGDVDYWHESGVNTYINTNTRIGDYPRTLENEYTDLLNIGKIFNVEAEAQVLVDEMREEIEETLELVKEQESQTVSIIEFMGDDIYNYGESTLGGGIW